MEKKNGLYFRKANAKATIVPSYSVETYFAVSEEQAKRKRIKRCIYPELPDHHLVYSEMHSLSENLYESKERYAGKTVWKDRFLADAEREGFVFGDGKLATGGFGMAGGMMVLGGLVAGPALIVMGLLTSAKSQEKLEYALANKAQADEVVESLNAATYQCSAIRRRSYMFYNLLAHLDSYFLEQVWKMQDIVATEGVDYRAYKPESKKCIAAAASTACTIKAVLDTPILTQEGELTEASEKIVEEIGEKIYK